MAKFSGALTMFAEKAKERDAFWVERAKLQFAVSLERQRRAAGLPMLLLPRSWARARHT